MSNNDLMNGDLDQGFISTREIRKLDNFLDTKNTTLTLQKREFFDMSTIMYLATSLISDMIIIATPIKNLLTC
jgi:hypothetical protein